MMTNFAILLGINAIALLFMFLYFRRRIRKTLEIDAISEKLKKEVGSLILELNSTAERNIALLEDRIRALREAAQAADKRIAVLNRELERKEVQAGVYTSLGRVLRPGPGGRRDAPEPVYEPSKAEPPESFPSGNLTAEALELKRSLSEKATDKVEGTPPEPVRVTHAENQVSYEPTFREKVIDLSRKGFSRELIAAKLGSGLGEVDLALSIAEGKGKSEF